MLRDFRIWVRTDDSSFGDGMLSVFTNWNAPRDEVRVATMYASVVYSSYQNHRRCFDYKRSLAMLSSLDRANMHAVTAVRARDSLTWNG